MSQLSFLDPAPPTDRLFFALFPDAAAAEAVARRASGLRERHALRGRPLLTDRFHVTLNHLGDHAGLRRDIVEAATEAARTVQFPAFEVTFDRVESFKGRSGSRPLVLRGDQGLRDLLSFQRELGVALARAGLGRWVERQFTPHVTLLYDDAMIEGEVVEPLTWTVDEFVLVHSLLSQTRHIHLDRWKLNG
ncbi:MAG: 2'-5' RNA ligase family protein [Caulobacter sp.]|nr:2'-5' RNA ligase family protein [Caulobacter sp.]